MSPIQNEMVKRKLTLMIENIKDLEEVYRQGFDAYLKSRISRKFCERCLQENIEAASDINIHILVESGNLPPSDYRSAFLMMGKKNIITKELAEQLAPSAGLRNRIVHEYDVLDDKIVFNSIKVCLDLFPQYIKAINEFLSNS